VGTSKQINGTQKASPGLAPALKMSHQRWVENDDSGFLKAVIPAAPPKYPLRKSLLAVKADQPSYHIRL
jgi:hypothetical protein